jgi:hypothetical protein
MPVQTRSMLKKQYTNNIIDTPEPMKSTKPPDAPKKRKSNAIKLDAVEITIDDGENISNTNNLDVVEITSDDEDEDRNIIKTEEQQQPLITKREFCNHAVVLVDKINKSRDNVKFTYYLELCKYNLDNLKKVTFNKDRDMIEMIISKCEEFNKAIDEGVYDHLKYGLIKECNEYNTKVKELCYVLLLKM